MPLRTFVLFLSALVGATAIHAQTPPPLPPCLSASEGGSGVGCAVGSDFSYDLGAYSGLETLSSLFNGIQGVLFTYSFASTGGNLPPGLSLSPSGLLSGTFTTAGDFNSTLTVTIKLSVDGTVILPDSPLPFPLELVVTGYTGSPLTVDPAQLTFNLTQGAPATTKSVTIANHGSGALQFSASAATNSGGNWLKVSSGGPIPSFGSAAVSITADPSQLAPGTYSGSVSISAGSQSFPVSVLAVVTGNQPNLALSQTGLYFEAVVGGGATSPQPIAVLNSGSGTLSYSASASTISGGNWLSVSPGSGTSSASAAGAVTVSVNPSGLQAGTYYGKVSFSAPGAADSPQVASVVLNVVPPANSPGGFVQPTGLIFVGSAGGTNPVSQKVSITNPSPDASSYLVTPFSNGNISWLSATPTSGSVSATQPATVSVQPNLQGLASGVYIGDLTVAFVPPVTAGTTPSSAGQIVHVEVLLIVLPAGASSSVEGAGPRITTGCTPTQLIPVFTLLGAGFSATAGWPSAIEATVVDDCGNPLQAGNGNVNVTFSSGDPALSLASIGGGSWTATWNAATAAPNVTLTAQAQEIQPELTGHAAIGGMLASNAAVPSVSTGGIVSAANFVANQPLAPGSFGAIFGSNLADSLAGSSQFPLSMKLGGTSVFLNGEQLPLLFASGGQVNAIMPYDVPANTTQQLIVQRGSAISIPQPVVIAPAVPAIFTQNGAGTGAALYNVYKSDGTPLPNNSPVSAGDVIVLYGSGLGAVNPPVPAGSQAPLNGTLSYTADPVTVSIGGMTETAQFAGLAPGFAQLYQVNAVVPSGLPSGPVSVTISINGQQSAPVTITIQ